MRDYNCDSLKKLPVPDELVEKALAIGETPAVKQPRRYSARAFAAAAAVFVVVASVSLYFILGAKPALPVKDTTPVISQETVGKSTPAVVPTERTTAAPTEKSIRSSEAAPTQPAATVSSEAAVITEITQNEAARRTPTTGNMANSHPDNPTEAPVFEPTAVPDLPEPTEEPTERQDDPPSPTEGMPEPTESQTLPNPKKELTPIGFMVPQSSYTGDGNIYCRLYNSSGSQVGSEDLYDESHRVYYTTGSGYLFLSYSLSGIDEPLPPDNYTLVFYDDNGNDFYICSAYLSRK